MRRRGLAACGLLGAMAAASHADVLGELGGAPYSGQVGMEIRLPDGRTDTRWGRGTVQLVETTPGQARLMMTSEMSGERTRSQLEMPGRLGADGWRSDVPGVAVHIAPTDAISGSGEQDGRTLRFEGRLSDDRVDITNRIGLVSGLQGLPPGSEIVYRYRLSRTATAARSEASHERPCKRMAMRSVPIASTAGGGMSMAQVPYWAEYD